MFTQVASGVAISDVGTGQPSALPQDPQRRDGWQMLQVGARISFQNSVNISFQGAKVVLEEDQDPD